MRRCLRRNYRGSDHFGAAANYEDDIKMKEDQESVINSSKAPILAAEAISMEAVNEYDEHGEIDNLDGQDTRVHGLDQSGESQSRLSEAAEQTLQSPLESGDTPLANDHDLVESSTAIAPGYVPSEIDERIVFELPSSMVRPLRVLRGTFQASLIILSCEVLFFTLNFCRPYISYLF